MWSPNLQLTVPVRIELEVNTVSIHVLDSASAAAEVPVIKMARALVTVIGREKLATAKNLLLAADTDLVRLMARASVKVTGIVRSTSVWKVGTDRTATCSALQIQSAVGTEPAIKVEPADVIQVGLERVATSVLRTYFLKLGLVILA